MLNFSVEKDIDHPNGFKSFVFMLEAMIILKILVILERNCLHVTKYYI